MNATTKHSLKCAGILVIIAIICVAIPVIIKQILPVYVPKLDISTVERLNRMAPTGESDSSALNNDCFSIVDFDLDTFNAENKVGSFDKVLAIFKAEKGNNEGAYIIQTQNATVGYTNQIVVLWIAYSAEGKILKLEVQSTGSDFFLDNSISRDKLIKEVEGKSVLNIAEVTSLHASSNGPPGGSIEGIVNNLNLSFACFNAVSAGGGN